MRADELLAVLRLALARWPEAMVRCSARGEVIDVYLPGGSLSSEDARHLGRAGWCVQSTDASVTIFRALDGRACSGVEVERLERYAASIEASVSLSEYDVEHPVDAQVQP